jgi:hypothetical protein
MALFIFIISKASFFEIKGIAKPYISAVLILKIGAGYTMAYIYSHYYTSRKLADIFRYFDDSKVLYDSFFINPKHFAQMFFGIDTNEPYLYPYYDKMISWDHRYSSIVTRVDAVFRFFSLGYYTVHVVFICFLSLTGLTAIYKVLVVYVERYKKALFVAVFLMPSTLFWASGVLKEAIVVFALGMFVYSFNKLMLNLKSTSTNPFQRGNLLVLHPTFKGVGRCLLLVFSLALLSLTKNYVLMAIAPGLLCMWFLRTKQGTKLPIWSVYLMVYIVAVICVFTLPIHFAEKLYNKLNDFSALASTMNAGSTLHNISYSANVFSIIQSVPVALANVLLRPSVFDMNNLLAIPAAIENLLIVIVMFYAFVIGRKRLLSMPSWWYLCLYFSVALFILIGLTVPVMGSIVRYKIIALPFLMGALVMLIDKRKNVIA